MPAPVIGNPNPFNLTFPYPLIGTVVRPRGQGCSSCVHSTYCPALYWFRRGADAKAFEEQPIDDKSLGRACASWSDDPAQKATAVTADDKKENEYIYNQGIGSEANRNGITDPVTGKSGY
jgi:hypothetical protein